MDRELEVLLLLVSDLSCFAVFWAKSKGMNKKMLILFIAMTKARKEQGVFVDY